MYLHRQKNALEIDFQAHFFVCAKAVPKYSWYGSNMVLLFGSYPINISILNFFSFSS